MLKYSHSSLTVCSLCHLLKCAPNPKWLCHQSITHKTKYETTFSNNGYGTHKKIHVFFKKMLRCDWKHSNAHVMMSPFFFGFKFCTNVKNKYKNGIFYCFFFFFFEKKKSLELQKIENHVPTFPYWFTFGNNLKKCLDRFLYLVII